MTITKKKVMDMLDTIPDPEIGVSLVQLGLIYGVDIDQGKGLVTIRITLTSIGCPLFDLIAQPIKEKIMTVQGVKEVIVDLTFDPPWTVERMSEEAKQQLGFV